MNGACSWSDGATGCSHDVIIGLLCVQQQLNLSSGGLSSFWACQRWERASGTGAVGACSAALGRRRSLRGLLVLCNLLNNLK